jgi:hypothetical protein
MKIIKKKVRQSIALTARLLTYIRGKQMKKIEEICLLGHGQKNAEHHWNSDLTQL